MAISKNLIEKMGGEIEVASTPGRGSTFAFSLLFALQPKNQLAPGDLQGPGAERGFFEPHAARELDGLRILLVEDNLINQQVAKELLEASGMEVHIAVNGREAVEVLTRTDVHYDAALMDIQMPVMGGYEATRLIRQDKRRGGLPVIAMTAHAMVEERRKCLEAGMNDHLAKPIDPEQMLAVLRKWVLRPQKQTISSKPHDSESIEAHR